MKFDLIIVGGGPGGYPLALRMAAKGQKVALVDKKTELGGTCLNWGCIPTKALLASAKGFHFLKSAENYGLTIGEHGFDWNKIQERKNQIVSKLRLGIDGLLKKAGVTVFNGTAKVFSGKRVVIDDSDKNEITADKICLAVGSVPAAPGIFPSNREIFWTSDEALHAQEIPEKLLVIGGGVIGMELGQVFNEFGSQVTVVEMLPQILNGLDSATAKRLLPVFKKAGMTIMTGKKVEKLVENNGKAIATIDGNDHQFDKVLIAVGRKVNHSFCEGTDLELEFENGFVKIDDNFESSQPGIFAIGDAIKGPMLAHKASYDAMILSRQLSGDKIKANYSAVPSCVYTYPEIAWVGKSEDQLKAEGITYKTGRSMFASNGKALTAGEGEGQIKTFANDSGEVLGSVIWGPEASNMIVEATAMLKLGITAKDFSQVIHGHPTLSEAFLESVESLTGEGVH
jgi:dihydrolipoamide dehydrogenase